MAEFSQFSKSFAGMIQGLNIRGGRGDPRMRAAGGRDGSFVVDLRDCSGLASRSEQPSATIGCGENPPAYNLTGLRGVVWLA